MAFASCFAEWFDMSVPMSAATPHGVALVAARTATQPAGVFTMCAATLAVALPAPAVTAAFSISTAAAIDRSRFTASV
ncbi:hypothetical protein D3C72_387230 [compost metagenome]